MKNFKVSKKDFNWSIFIILTATLVVSGFFILINKAQAETLYVCPEECEYEDGDEYNSIQEAINNATSGDIINVSAWALFIEIKKPLTTKVAVRIIKISQLKPFLKTLNFFIYLLITES